MGRTAPSSLDIALERRVLCLLFSFPIEILIMSVINLFARFRIILPDRLDRLQGLRLMYRRIGNLLLTHSKIHFGTSEEFLNGA